jgi:hypothetical protein
MTCQNSMQAISRSRPDPSGWRAIFRAFVRPLLMSRTCTLPYSRRVHSTLYWTRIARAASLTLRFGGLGAGGRARPGRVRRSTRRRGRADRAASVALVSKENGAPT